MDGMQKVQSVDLPKERQRARKKEIEPDPKAETFVNDPEFADQGLTTEKTLAGLFLRCKGCNVRVRCKKRKDVRQHCFGRRTKRENFNARPEAAKLELGHYKALLKGLADAHERKIMEEAKRLQREAMEAQARRLVGHSLPVENVVERAVVLKSMWSCGIPLAKLEHPRFVDLVERPHLNLGGREGVRREMPVVFKQLKDDVAARLRGRFVSIVFDGAQLNEAVEGLLARYVDDDYQICHVCIGARMVSRSLNSQALLQLIQQQLLEANVLSSQIVMAVSDSAPVNSSMISLWNQGAKPLAGSDYNSVRLIWQGCVSHALSNSGTAMRKEAKLCKEFFHGFKKMSTTSTVARHIWEEKTGISCPVLCDNRWWCWYDCAKKIFGVWDKVLPCLKEIEKQGIAVKSCKKMLAISERHEWDNLMWELETCILFGKEFRDLCLMLEGDGFLLPYGWVSLRSCIQLMREITVQGVRHPFLFELGERMKKKGLYAGDRDIRLAKLLPIAAAGINHFRTSVYEKMFGLGGDSLGNFSWQLLEAASLFFPLEIICDAQEVTGRVASAVKVLVQLKGITHSEEALREGLFLETHTYQVEAMEFKEQLAKRKEEHTPKDLWDWWRSQRFALPTWFSVAKVLVLIQLASATIERFFSLVKGNTSEQQNAEYADTFQARCMAMYNL